MSIKREKLFETLTERGYIYQMTNKEEVKKLLNGNPITAYVGIDPTADSLHIGHCFPFFVAKYLQEAGHKVIVLLGGATAKIGDPSGKTDMRKMIDDKFINQNYENIKKIVGKFLDLGGDNPAIIVNNNDWFKSINYVDFMREIGVHFNVNKMLASDIYAKRLESGGLTFFEMGYMLMQAYDFIYLNKKYNCVLQFGGSDQWGNILAGADLGRKLAIAGGKDAETFQAFTNILLTNHEGQKMGKTENGAMWVLKEKTSPFEFYQYFYNVDDKDVETLLKVLTRLPLGEIADLMKGDIRIAKQKLAYEITKIVHGEEDAKQAVEDSKKLFSAGGGAGGNIPTEAIQIERGCNAVDMLAKTSIVKSKREARELIEAGAILIDNKKVMSIDECLDKTKTEFLIKKGKKTFLKIKIE